MEECVICSKTALIERLSCGIPLCKKHYLRRKISKQADFMQKKIGIGLSCYYSASASENILSKITIINDCKKLLITETQNLIASIQNNCLQAINKFKVKEQYYFSLLKIITQKRSSAKERKKIDCELNISIVTKVPSCSFREIEKFYRFDFLKEFSNFTQINNPKRFLADYYGLFLESHTKKIENTVISFDSKYIISGSEDTTLRIWDLKNARQVAVLAGHTAKVGIILLTSDNKYIISTSGQEIYGKPPHEDNSIRI